MSQIRILPENLANQIAAGEVVERPASVVKELVENSIDAGATNLAVEVEGGGASLIRVIDDGRGMDQDDILLSLERHATSKLIEMEQLDDIRTLGFRGEAIPSIASVSRLSITSRQSGSELGNRVEVRFGRVMKVHEMGCRTGTVVEIRDLFGNVPARKKFLKTARTELSHIEEVIRSYGLVKPELAINYSVNGREVISLPPASGDGIKQRITKLLGCGTRQELVPVPSPRGEGTIEISGFLLPPDHSAGPGANLRAFVNGRPVRDRLIGHAISEGLRNYLMKGRKPAGVLFIDLPPAEVDVNVHPAKQEIRFHKANVIHQLIVLAVSGAMANFQDELKSSLFGSLAPSSSPHKKSPQSRPSAWNSPTSKPKFAAGEPVFTPATKKSGDFGSDFYDRIGSDDGGQVVSEPEQPSFESVIDSGGSRFHRAPSADLAEPDYPTVEKTVDSEPGVAFGRLRIIGQLLDTYILCEGEDGMVAIDQHAAQERLIFEKLKKQYEQGRIASQPLLFPKTMEFGHAEIGILEGAAEEIEKMGIDIREFGGSTYVLKAVPAVMAKVPPEEILRGVFDQFAGISGGLGRTDASRRLDSVLSEMACKAAIKARQRLSVPEMQSLLDEMIKNDVFSHCPHGRPVARKFSDAEIRKWFYRT